MVNICPSCSSENRDIARYCDQCGAPIAEDAVPVSAPAAAASASASSGVAKAAINWGGLALVIVLLGVAVFLFMPQKKVSEAGMPPMAGGAQGNEMMGEVLKQVQGLKDELAKDPTNVETLNKIYQLYGQVGKIDKAREYLTQVLDGIRAKLKSGEFDTEKAISTTADVAQAAVMAGDGEGAMQALEFFHELKPDDLRVLPFLGNLSYDLGKVDDSIKWYSQFLEKAEPEKFEEYWNVKVDRATMYLQKADDTKDSTWLDKAQSELEATNVAQPKMFNAWFNLGQVYLKRPDKVTARSMFEKSLALATDDISKYKAEREIALIDGKEPPAMPNPHGEGSLEDMGLGPAKPGVPNPHGEGFDGTGGGGMANPHGEGFGGGSGGGMENPHGEGGGMANPHGENPHGEGGA